jgi:hypothetical protein
LASLTAICVIAGMLKQESKAQQSSGRDSTFYLGIRP